MASLPETTSIRFFKGFRLVFIANRSNSQNHLIQPELLRISKRRFSQQVYLCGGRQGRGAEGERLRKERCWHRLGNAGFGTRSRRDPPPAWRVVWRRGRFQLFWHGVGADLQPAHHEVHQSGPSFKVPIRGRRQEVLEEGLPRSQHGADERVVVAQLQEGVQADPAQFITAQRKQLISGSCVPMFDGLEHEGEVSHDVLDARQILREAETQDPSSSSIGLGLAH